MRYPHLIIHTSDQLEHIQIRLKPVTHPINSFSSIETPIQSFWWVSKALTIELGLILREHFTVKAPQTGLWHVT